ncbi:HAMP domain-containing sensor histidine kinase [Clostridium aestuarii]|uniref:histidine kinase n=1 Tax=Clostridium aestuarii TaxID=338193 RepID=A0ABT4D3G0_9CLOT|nr:HAMP domain-containing sensor histidine kinase [Clostridium aestuarii]MCY6485771.1 HAMP domain-containing sensor histidine kinase [Clostridium aestuarii]
MKIKEKFLNLKNEILKISVPKWTLNIIKRAICFAGKLRHDIRSAIFLVFAICALGAFITYYISGECIKSIGKSARIDYTYSIEKMSRKAENIANEININQNKIKDNKEFKEILEDNNIDDNYESMIVDLDGKVMYKSDNVDTVKIDIYTTIKNIMKSRDYKLDEYYYESKEHVSFYPINIDSSKAYLIVKGVPTGEIIYYEHLKDEEFVLAVILATAVFIGIFLLLTKRKTDYIHQITDGVIRISQGNLDYRIDEKGKDELTQLSANINYMAKELKQKIQKERQADKTKNELITNVSHDLRTPLTSVIGYLGLIKENKYKNEQQLNEYVEIAFNKSEKLKILIEDLFEYTKVANHILKLHKQEVVLNELLSQLIEEFVPIFEESGLQIEKEISKEKIVVNLDTDKTVRVFENLIMNAIKYSFKPSKIKVCVYKDNNNAVVSIHNKGRNITKEHLPYLFERFYKADKSRTSQNEGSGLGLAIAKNIVEMHNGEIWAECEDENIWFYVSFKLIN